MSTIRAGMVAVAPLTMIGGMFLIAAYLPSPEWDARVAPCRALFLLLQIDPADGTPRMEGLGSQELFTAILIALVTVRTQKFFADRNLVVRLPASVPAVVYQSFLSLTPRLFLVTAFWVLRFTLRIDLNGGVQRPFSPLGCGARVTRAIAESAGCRCRPRSSRSTSRSSSACRSCSTRCSCWPTC